MSANSVPTEQRAALAAELLEDIELNRLSTEALLLKTSRLARLVGAEMLQKILRCELGGYNVEGWDRIAEMTGRWTNREKNLGWWGPLAEVEGTIAAYRAELQQSRVPDVQLSLSSANPHEIVSGIGGANSRAVTTPVVAVLNRAAELREALSSLAGIRPRVMRLVYDFVASTFYELTFSSTAGTVFQRFQSEVDGQLNPETATRLAAVAERLAAGDPEAISHAMMSCRRLIEAAADVVFPPRDTAVVIDEQPVDVRQQQYLNRLNSFVAERVVSKSRRARIRRTLKDIHDRASAGVHDEVTNDEARALSLQTYAILGEIVLLPAHDHAAQDLPRPMNDSPSIGTSGPGPQPAPLAAKGDNGGNPA